MTRRSKRVVLSVEEIVESEARTTDSVASAIDTYVSTA